MAVNPKPLRMKKHEYVLACGTMCPNCKGLSLYYSPQFGEGEDGRIRRKVRCNDCGEYWFEIYKLVDYQM